LPAPDPLGRSCLADFIRATLALPTRRYSRFPLDQQLFLCLVLPDFSGVFLAFAIRRVPRFLAQVRDFIASVLEDFIGSRFQHQFGEFTPHSDKSNIHTNTAMTIRRESDLVLLRILRPAARTPWIERCSKSGGGRSGAGSPPEDSRLLPAAPWRLGEHYTHPDAVSNRQSNFFRAMFWSPL